jgi:hypothetical protein
VRGGIRCDNVYDPNDCRNVILRHHAASATGGDDNLRLSGRAAGHRRPLSFANARDENVEISRSQDITVQYSVIAEPVGDHYRYGGVLINYSKDRFPLANISMHHNVWNGVHGRLPEISCEENGDGPGTTNCAGRRLRIEVSNNVSSMSSDPVYYNRCVGTNEGNDCAASARNFLLDLNFVGNVMHRRRTIADRPMFANEVSAAPRTPLLDRQPARLARAPCQQRHARPPEPPGARTAPRHHRHPQGELLRCSSARPAPSPATRWTPASRATSAAAVDSRPAAWTGGNGVDRGDARLGFTAPPTHPLPTRDGDGMPDEWETAHGLRPDCPGARPRHPRSRTPPTASRAAPRATPTSSATSTSSPPSGCAKTANQHPRPPHAASD